MGTANKFRMDRVIETLIKQRQNDVELMHEAFIETNGERGVALETKNKHADLILELVCLNMDIHYCSNGDCKCQADKKATLLIDELRDVIFNPHLLYPISEESVQEAIKGR